MTFNEYQEELWHLKNDSMSMFEKRLLNGDIACIEPYFDGHAILQRSYHFMMARHGLYIERLIEAGNEYDIAEIVRYGHAEEYYEDWANDSEYEVQAALLEKGLYVDILAKSKNGDVRYEVARRYPERTLAYIKSLEPNKQRNLGTTLLMLQTHPDRKALKYLFGLDWHKTGYNLQILKSKYKVMHKVPTVIEKTMTPYQLYQTGNPLWKLNLSGYNIDCVKYGQYKMERENLLLTEEDFKQLAEYDNSYMVDCYIEWRLENRKG